MRRVLGGLSRQQAVTGLVDAAAVPVGRFLFGHFQAPVGKVFIRERGIDCLT